MVRLSEVRPAGLGEWLFVIVAGICALTIAAISSNAPKAKLISRSEAARTK